MTIKEIAKLAGVSTATVSYVINNSAPVREETKEKVRTIIRNTGYTGNSIAKSLRVNKTKTLGVIVEDMKSEQVPILLDGIHETAELYGYKTLVSNLRIQSKQHYTHLNSCYTKKELDDTISILQGTQVDGILYIGAYNERIDYLPNCIKPIILCNSTTSLTNIFSVSYSNEKAAYMATKHLIQLGHNRIGLITGNQHNYSVKQRQKGYEHALMEASIPINYNYIEEGYWGFHKGKEAAITLLNQAIAPTAIFAMNDLMAIGAYEAASELGYTVPMSLSIIGFDNAESSKYLRPRMSTISIPLKEMGSRASELLIHQIEDLSRPQQTIELSCELLIKSSTIHNKEKLIFQY